ncbi:hypothetical protein [Shewanella psychrotolerans]|uniref:hypothetical protein n=1 Tax=Shewanella psychrotolerans TaxID=2864206 RepID=UPI001C660616|nr:hypothetical protein [Shewanella psychrotolerans]QYK02674.1 hypothetical protein K0I62_06960 [Shewanella psychrotolerans]
MNPISSLLSSSNNTIAAEAYGNEVSREPQSQASSIHSDKVSLSNQANADKATGPAIAEEAVSLSSRAMRAQKIEAMAKDFFADGQFTTAQIPKLIQRLHQDGILSDNQLNRLSSAGFDIPETSSHKQSLMDFINEQKETLTQTDPDSVLMTVLDDAKSVLNNMDSVDGAQYSQKAARVSAQLSVFINADAPMEQIEKQQWQGLKSTMQLAASMGNSQQFSGQMNSYLALSKRIT